MNTPSEINFQKDLLARTNSRLTCTIKAKEVITKASVIPSERQPVINMELSRLIDSIRTDHMACSSINKKIIALRKEQ